MLTRPGSSGLDHSWTVEEVLTTIVVLQRTNNAQEGGIYCVYPPKKAGVFNTLFLGEEIDKL